MQLRSSLHGSLQPNIDWSSRRLGNSAQATTRSSARIDSKLYRGSPVGRPGRVACNSSGDTAPLSVGVVGGGVCGLATALQLTQKFPDLDVTVITDQSIEETTSYGSGGAYLWLQVLLRYILLQVADCRLQVANCLAGRLDVALRGASETPLMAGVRRSGSSLSQKQFRLMGLPRQTSLLPAQ